MPECTNLILPLDRHGGTAITRGKDSSRHVLARRLVALGVSLDQMDSEPTLTAFRTLDYRRKGVTDPDPEALAARNSLTAPGTQQ